ncbi:hypothetical protein D3C78_1597120 [compost metagenome]
MRAQHHRIPQRVSPGREALVAFVNAGYDCLIVGFNFVWRVNQHQTATGYRRQFGFELLITVGLFHACAGVFLEFRSQQREIAWVQFGQLQAVLFAQQLASNQRRAWVVA